MNISIEIPKKMALAYSKMCKPLCKELDIPETAFDILMFLGNNPSYKAASDIVEVRHLKANLVSININKLVQEKYLIRKENEDDRRKVELILTDKAQPIIKKGRELQKSFAETLLNNVDENSLKIFFEVMHLIEKNADKVLENK